MISNKTTLFALLAGFVSAFTFLAPTAAQDDAYDPDALMAQMDAVSSSYRTIRKGLSKGKEDRAGVLKAIVEMQLAMVKGKTLLPTKFAQMPPEDQKKNQEAYRAEMIKSVETLLKLERLVLENKFEEAAALAQTLNELKGEGHSKYQE